MSNSNLWPSKGRILNLGQDAPSEILKEQAGYIKQIDPMLTARVKENYGRNDHLPLKAISFWILILIGGKLLRLRLHPPYRNSLHSILQSEEMGNLIQAKFLE